MEMNLCEFGNSTNAPMTVHTKNWYLDHSLNVSSTVVLYTLGFSLGGCIFFSFEI